MRTIYLILVIFIILYLVSNNKTENFQWDLLSVGKISDNCYEERNKDCLSYSNCGLCRNASQQQCIPGDVHGPFFKEGCQEWTYTNYYDRYIFDDKITKTTPSWDAFLPGYEIMYPSPPSVFRL